MTEKRFEVGNLKIQDTAPKGRVYLLDMQGGVNALCSLINGLNDKSNRLEKENEQLKSELKIYRNIASCSNCHYHNYDWYDDGDDFEVCDKGNDMSDYICKDWREL